MHKWQFCVHYQIQLWLKSHRNNIRFGTKPNFQMKTSFSAVATKLWNDTDESIQNSASRKELKGKIRRKLLGTYKSKVSCQNPRCPDRQSHDTWLGSLPIYSDLAFLLLYCYAFHPCVYPLSAYHSWCKENKSFFSLLLPKWNLIWSLTLVSCVLFFLTNFPPHITAT